MPFDILAGPLQEVRAISTTGTGTALTTSSVVLAFPPGTQAFQVVGRNLASSASAVQVAFSPWLLVLKTTDSLATAANLTDYTDAAQDGSTSTDVVLSSLASTGAVWIGSHRPFRGAAIDVDLPNSNASVLSGTYWNGASMSNITLSDGTASGGVTLAVDGSLTWNVPSDWVAAPLTTIGTAATTVPYAATRDLYWVKLVVSVALDSSTTLNSLMALPRSTAYMDLAAESPELSLRVQRGPGGLSGVELRCDTGTANAIVNVLTGGMFT